MNILNIIIKEVKQSFRDKKATLMMTLFPIVLIAILGAAFSGAFSKSVKFDDIKVLYATEGKGQIVDAFSRLTKDKSIDGVKFYKTEDKAGSIDKIRNSKYSCFINANEEKKSLELYKNSKYNVEAGVVELILRTYIQKYNAISEIAKVAPMKLSSIKLQERADYVENKTLSRKRSPRAIDYYGVTMLSLFATYGALSGVFAILSEARQKTGRRIFAAPIKKYEFLTGKILGVVVTTALQIGVVFLVSKYGYNVYYGENYPALFAIIFSLVFMISTFGVGVAFIFNKENKASALVNLIIPVFAFLGGGYTPVSGEGIFGVVTKMSPLKWTNDAIFKIIYDNNGSLVFEAIAINVVIAVVFIIIASLGSRKEEALL